MSRATNSYDVYTSEPKPNKLFDEFTHFITRFLTFSKPVACAHCGKKRKRHWTHLVFFHVMEEDFMVLRKSEKEYPPLTPVCSDHILGEVTGFPDDDKQTGGKPLKAPRKKRGESSGK